LNAGPEEKEGQQAEDLAKVADILPKIAALSGTEHKRTETSANSEFNKQTLFVFDESELEHRRIQQMHGNMQLIVELYKHE
jgi:hypothetical protein